MRHDQENVKIEEKEVKIEEADDLAAQKAQRNKENSKRNRQKHKLRNEEYQEHIVKLMNQAEYLFRSIRAMETDSLASNTTPTNYCDPFIAGHSAANQ